MTRQLLAALGAIIAAGAASAQSRPLSAGPNRMELRVERREAGEWKPVDPSSVFASGDQLRFRFKTNFPGFLYVMNHGTSGEYLLLYPTKEAGESNRIDGGRDYVVPGNDGAFKISGPEGFDVMYWLISPSELRAEDGTKRSGYVPLPPPPKNVSKALASLRPRCDDTIFRARGECVDANAGVKQVRTTEQLPDNLKPVPNLTARELVFIREPNKAVVSSPAPLDGPVIYEYRLAHR